MGAAIAIGVFTAGAGLWGADAQEELDHDRVELAYKDNLEKIRRRGFTQEATKGKAKARSENAGVRHTAGSTPQGYMDVITSEFKKELDWMKKYAKEARRLGLDQAHLDRKIGGINAISSGIQAGMGAYTG
jgi:hypothetical protein